MFRITEPRTVQSPVGRSPRRQACSIPPIPNFKGASDAHDAALSAIQNDFSLVSPRNIKEVVSEISAICRELTEKGDYKAAKHAEVTLREAYQKVIDEKAARIQSEKIESLSSTIESHKFNLDRLISDWKSVIESAKRRRDSELSELTSQMALELSEFDKSYSGEIPPSMLKFSPELLEMRQKQRYTALSKDYDGAMIIKSEADAVEAEELKEIRNRWVQTLNHKRAELLKSSEERLEMKSKKWELTIQRMEAISKDETAKMSESIRRMEGKFGHSDAALQSIKGSARIKTFPMTPIASSRTRFPPLASARSLK